MNVKCFFIICWWVLRLYLSVANIFKYFAHRFVTTVWLHFTYFYCFPRERIVYYPLATIILGRSCCLLVSLMYCDFYHLLLHMWVFYLFLLFLSCLILFPTASLFTLFPSFIVIKSIILTFRFCFLSLYKYMLLLVHHSMLRMRRIHYNCILLFLDYWNLNRMFQFI